MLLWPLTRKRNYSFPRHSAHALLTPRASRRVQIWRRRLVGWMFSAPCTQTRFMDAPSREAAKAVLRAATRRAALHRGAPRRARWHADAPPCAAAPASLRTNEPSSQPAERARCAPIIPRIRASSGRCTPARCRSRSRCARAAVAHCVCVLPHAGPVQSELHRRRHAAWHVVVCYSSQRLAQRFFACRLRLRCCTQPCALHMSS